MRVIEQYGMFTAEGDALVDRIVRAGLKLGQMDAADNATIWKFVQRELRKLAATEDFAEATDTVVREEVFTALWDNLPGFNVSEEVYYG
jgi:hypothetical protein